MSTSGVLLGFTGDVVLPLTLSIAGFVGVLYYMQSMKNEEMGIPPDPTPCNRAWKTYATQFTALEESTTATPSEYNAVYSTWYNAVSNYKRCQPQPNHDLPYYDLVVKYGACPSDGTCKQHEQMYNGGWLTTDVPCPLYLKNENTSVSACASLGAGSMGDSIPWTWTPPEPGQNMYVCAAPTMSSQGNVPFWVPEDSKGNAGGGYCTLRDSAINQNAASAWPYPKNLTPIGPSVTFAAVYLDDDNTYHGANDTTVVQWQPNNSSFVSFPGYKIGNSNQQPPAPTFHDGVYVFSNGNVQPFAWGLNHMYNHNPLGSGEVNPCHSSVNQTDYSGRPGTCYSMPSETKWTMGMSQQPDANNTYQPSWAN